MRASDYSNTSCQFDSVRAGQILGAHSCRKILQVSKPDSLSDLPHDVKVKVDIVVGGEDGGGDFSSGEEMPKICASIAVANGTRTLRIDGTLIFDVASVLDEHAALAGVQASVAGGASGENAIHHIDAECDVISELFGAADAHEVARAIGGKKSGYFSSHFTRDIVRFADSEAAHGVTGKVEGEKLVSAFAAQVGEGGALHDAELPLGQAAIFLSMLHKIVASALCPGSGALESGFCDGAWRGRFDAFIEHHGDVCAKGQLNLGGLLRSEEMLRAVEMGTKAHAVVGYFAQIGEAEDLVATGIGEDGTGPRHERMQAAEFADQSVTGTQIKMIGVGENNFGAEGFEGFLGESLNGRGGANGHEGRRFDDAMRRGEKAAPRASGIGVLNFEGKTHFASVSGEDEGPAHAQNNKDCPDPEDDEIWFRTFQFFRVDSRKADG